MGASKRSQRFLVSLDILQRRSIHKEDVPIRVTQQFDGHRGTVARTRSPECALLKLREHRGARQTVSGEGVRVSSRRVGESWLVYIPSCTRTNPHVSTTRGA